MVTEQHLNGTYYKYYQTDSNKNLLFLLPGQSLSPRAFWDFKLPENKTHVDYFLEAGIDVVLFDPKGYGNSSVFENYDRVEYAKQILAITSNITKQYKNKTIFGFSTSTAPALIAGHIGYFNKIIIHSPVIQENLNFFPNYDKTQEVLKVNFIKLLTERIYKISDVLIPASNKIEGWIESVKVISGSSWTAPYQTVHDIHTYWTQNKQHNLTFDTSCNILSIVGEYDNEIQLSIEGYNRFKKFFTNCKEVTIPNSTHFSMWENNCSITRNAMIEFIKD
jgi:pimeloyl-ACP methyl ester carboxylesterase